MTLFWLNERNSKFAFIMKEKKIVNKTLKGFTKNPKLDKYADKVLFKDKVKMANHILKTVGLPKA